MFFLKAEILMRFLYECKCFFIPYVILSININFFPSMNGIGMFENFCQGWRGVMERTWLQFDL